MSSELQCSHYWFDYNAYIIELTGLGVGYIMGQFDGILGLGFEGLSLGGATTVFKNAIDQNLVAQPVFAFSMGDNADGELTLGGYGELFCPIHSVFFCMNDV